MHTDMERRKVHSPRGVPNTASRSGIGARDGIPNSAMLSMMGADRASEISIDELGERVRSRLPSVRERSQSQIPQAETEADRLSSAVNAGPPESVKAVMGQRMGADFSGVRFHTGAVAAAKANAMGARAYTSGADVYFGEGGFDPAVAAHELVHTAQQGMVDSGASVMSAPVGGVQMWPWSKKKKRSAEDSMAKTRALGRESDAIADELIELGDLTGGKYDASEDEVDALLQEEDGNGAKMTEEELEAWLEQSEKEIDGNAAFDTDSMREMIQEQMEMMERSKANKPRLKKLERRLRRLQKKMDRHAKRTIKESERMLAKQDAKDAFLSGLSEEEFADLELAGASDEELEAELNAMMQEDENSPDLSEEELEAQMAQMEQEIDDEEAARIAEEEAAVPKKKKGFFSRIGSGIKKIGKKIWDKTGGRAIRKHHDAMNELHEAMQSGDWDQLTPKERKKWIRKNPIAYKRYIGSDKVKAETALRVGKRQQEKEAAEAFMTANAARLGPSSMLTPGAAPAAGTAGTPGAAPSLAIGRGKTDEAGAPEEASTLDKVGTFAGKVDNAMIPPGVANSFQEAGWISKTGENVLGGSLGAVNILTGGVGAYQSFGEVKDAFATGGKMDKVNAIAGMTGNLAKIGGGMGSIAKAAGKEVGGKLAAGADIITGGIDVFKGSQQIHAGRMKANAMDEFQKSRYGALEREDLAGKDLLFRDIATQGKMEGTRQKIKGAGKVVTGAVDAAAGVAELSGAASAVGAGLKVGNAVLKSGFAAANAVQKNRMVNKVVQQTTGLTDEKIKEFQKQAGIKSFSRAKQALMKSMGYESGARAELYADQTEKRGQYLAEMANSGMEGDKANQLVTGLGVKKGAAGYDAGEITKSLGHWKSRAAIAKGYNSIKKKAAQRRNQGATP